MTNKFILPVSVPLLMMKVLYPLLLIFILLIPNIFFTLNGSDFYGASLITRIGFLILCTALLSLPLLFLNLQYFFWVGFAWLLLSPVELLHLYLFKAPVSTGVLAAIIHTNYHEAFEFTSQYLFFLLLF